MATLHYPGTPGTPLYFGRPSDVVPGPGTLLTTITLVNTSGTEQAAGFVSPMFGQPFKQGDVPSGEYPAFTLTDETPVPATIHSVTSWPDGSMKWCGVLLRVPAAVAGNGSLTINIKNGGTAPASSSRAMSDFAAADLSVEAVGVTNLSGTWTATLSDAIANGTAVQIGDGPAGAIWRVLGDFKQASAAHGQLVCWHYVAALQDASGGLLGVRYLGRPDQPWSDVTSPAPNRRVFTAALFSAGVKVRDIEAIQNTSGTVGSNISAPHFSSWFTCGASGQYDFFPGTKSSDCTCFVQHDPEYIISTKVVPAVDISISCSPMPSVDYRPYCKGNHVTYGIGSTGERSEIGTVPQWAAIHIIEQDAVSLRSVRVNALSSAGINFHSRDYATKMPVAAVDIRPSYTGLRVEPNYRFYGGKITNNGVDVVNPADKTSLWADSEEVAHRPDPNYYAYVVTGEPQYLDLLVESGAQCILYSSTGGQQLSTAFPLQTVTVGGVWNGDRSPVLNGVTYKGAGWVSREQLARMTAWALRDIVEVAAIYPDSCPSGTQFRLYMRDVVDKSFEFAIAYRDAMVAAGHTQWASEGHHFFRRSVGFDSTDAPWCIGYLSMAVCHMSGIYPTSNANAFRSHLSKFWEAIAQTGDISRVAAYSMSTWTDAGRIVSVSDACFSSYTGTMTLTFDAATNVVTLTGTRKWVPTNGDTFAFGASYTPFSVTKLATPYYAVNVTADSFQLSETPGGAPLDIATGAVNTLNYYCSVQNYPSAFSFQGVSTGNSYFANVRGAIRAHRSLGDSVPTSYAAIEAKAALTAVEYGVDPKYSRTSEVL